MDYYVDKHICNLYTIINRQKFPEPKTDLFSFKGGRRELKLFNYSVGCSAGSSVEHSNGGEIFGRRNHC